MRLVAALRRRAKFFIFRRRDVFLSNNSIRLLAGVYGWRTTLRLFWAQWSCRRLHPAIDQRLQALSQKMAGQTMVEGSATKAGFLYHDYPLPEYAFKTHRTGSLGRVAKLRTHLSIDRTSVLDLGCASGGISIGLALLGASKVVGVDYDSAAVALGKAVAEKYRIKNVDFQVSPVEDLAIPESDTIIWLSQWMWVVNQHGLEYAKDLLFEVPKKSGASIMAFESAANDGKAAIAGLTQDDIAEFLRLWTPYTVIENVGPFDDGWRTPNDQRMVFICSQPKSTWPGKEATINRVDRHTVIKEFEPQRFWAKELESRCLQRLEGFPNFPRLLDEGDNWIKMTWGGNRVTSASQLEQLTEVVRNLQAANIVHRDICPDNLLYCEGQLYLLDFGWALVDGKFPSAIPGPNLGRGFYADDHLDDAGAAERVRAHFRKMEDDLPDREPKLLGNMS